MLKILISLLLTIVLTNCSHTIDRLQNIGKKPSFDEVPLYQYEKADNHDHYLNNSLWKPSSKSFFKNIRADGIGDIIKVNINIADNAKLKNESKRARQTTENLPLPKVFGINNVLSDASSNNGSLLDIKGNNSNLGSGTIDRNEKINTQIAASVVKILPNGNLVIQGTQEIRVNFELRQLHISGIIRPEDISIDNSVDSSKIAELRVSYGGSGHISDVQQPRLGSQLIDIVSPF